MTELKKTVVSQCFKAPLRSHFLPRPRNSFSSCNPTPFSRGQSSSDRSCLIWCCWKGHLLQSLPLCPCPRLASSQRLTEAQAYQLSLLCFWVGQPRWYNLCSRAPSEVKRSHMSAENTPLPNSSVAQSCFPLSLPQYFPLRTLPQQITCTGFLS